MNVRKIYQLEEHASPYASDLMVIRDVLTGKDKKIKVSTLIGNKGVPTWDAETSWKADETCTEFCDARDIVEWQFKFWKSLIVNNQGNIPQEGANWEEVSEAEAQVSGSPDRLVKTCIKEAHGFIAKDILTLNGAGVLVKVTDPSTQQRIGIVSEVVDEDTFKLALAGYVSGLSGLVAGTKYYGQASGTITDDVSDMPALIADSETSGYILSSGGASSGSVPNQWIHCGDFSEATDEVYPSTGGTGPAGALEYFNTFRLTVAKDLGGEERPPNTILVYTPSGWLHLNG